MSLQDRLDPNHEESLTSPRRSTEKRVHSSVATSNDDLEENPVKKHRNEAVEIENSSDVAAPSSSASDFVLNAEGVPGLHYYPNFVTESEEKALLDAVDANEWDSSLKRRVQHFGLRYDYTSKSLDKNAKIERLPAFTDESVARMSTLGWFATLPDQCIINEYIPGQGINAHIDRVDSFGSVVASLSLGSSVIMTFSTDSRKVDLLLEARSLVFLTGDARFKWKHSIAPRKSDSWRGFSIPRDRRVSFTYRTIRRDPPAESASSSSL